MRRARAAVGLLVACSLAVACGPQGPVPETVSVGLALEPPHLDPTATAAAATDEVVYANVFEGLTRIGPNGEVLPGLARAWSVSEDGTTYRFTLQDGVRFHDGTAFDSSDVVFSLERARAPQSTNAQKALFAPIASIAAPDPSTVTITLTQPSGDFLFNLGQGDAVIVAPESAASNASRPVGTGPFRFDRWMKGTLLVLVRSPDYWGPPARLERVVFRIIPDAAASYAALLAGDVDSFPNFPAPELLGQLAGDPRFTIAIGTTEGETLLAINNRRPPLDDVRVRRAIGHAIDRAALIQGLMFGHGMPIGSHFAPHHPDHVDLTGLSAYDPARARALLAEAGHASGLTLSLKLPPPMYARRGGEIIAAQLRAVGITAEIEAIEWAQWLEQVFSAHDFDLTIVSHTEPLDIGIYARPDYYFGYDSERFRSVMAARDRASDPAVRRDLIQQAQRILAEDAVNAFLFQLPKIGVWRAELRGQWVNAPVQATDMTGVFRARDLAAGE